MESNLLQSKMYADFDRDGNISIMEMSHPEVETLLLSLRSFIDRNKEELKTFSDPEIPENVSDIDIGKIQRKLFCQQSIRIASEIVSKIELAQQEKIKYL